MRRRREGIAPLDSRDRSAPFARPRGRLLAPGSLGLGIGFSLSLGLDAAEKISLLLKIVLALCNSCPHINPSQATTARRNLQKNES